MIYAIVPKSPNNTEETASPTKPPIPKLLLDIWQYIRLENIPIVPLYFAKERPCVEIDGNLIMADDDRLPEQYRDQIRMRMVRFRTLGCWPLTGAVESEADTIEKIVEEMMTTTKSERTTRVIDFDQDASMEQKKREGYF